MSLSTRELGRFDLYERCVQAPELQARFLGALHGRAPAALCEDFCGPASIARAWVALGASRTGIGVDRDSEPLAHALLRAEEMGLEQGAFVTERSDVLAASSRADIIAALNFGVCELHRRGELAAYLARVRERLNSGGIFVADLYGGESAFRPGSTHRRFSHPDGELLYTWEQLRADPLRGMVENAIHFTLPDGREMRDAFVYSWRLWAAPELRDAMLDAGFRSTEVHTSYGGAIDGDGNPVPAPARDWEQIDSDYVAYVVARC